MKMNNRILWLRASFWIGAVIDLIAAVQMLLPDLWASFNGIAAHRASPELSTALWAGAPLMLGWTILLIWADRKPIERKGVLLITVLPVVAGLMLNNLLSLISGLSSASSIVPVLLLQAALAVLFTFSYFNASGS